MHGKVFFTIPSGPEAGDYVCSRTALNSRNRSVVWTAGHCVFDTDGRVFATNWVFVPGFSARARRSAGRARPPPARRRGGSARPTSAMTSALRS